MDYRRRAYPRSHSPSSPWMSGYCYHVLDHWVMQASLPQNILPPHNSEALGPISGAVVDMDCLRCNVTSWRDMVVQSAALCTSHDPLTRLISLADNMKLHLRYEQVPEKRLCSCPPYENQTVRQLSSEIVCLQSLRFAIGRAARNEKPTCFLHSLAASPKGTQKCLLELKALEPSLAFTDPSREMLKHLHTTIQSLIANKQVSRNLERRLMVQLNTAR